MFFTPAAEYLYDKEGLTVEQFAKKYNLNPEELQEGVDFLRAEGMEDITDHVQQVYGHSAEVNHISDRAAVVLNGKENLLAYYNSDGFVLATPLTREAALAILNKWEEPS